MLRIRLTLLKFAFSHFCYRNLIMADMFLLELELCVWRALRDRTRAINAVSSCHARTRHLLQVIRADVEAVKDIRSQLSRKINQIKSGQKQ